MRVHKRRLAGLGAVVSIAIAAAGCGSTSSSSSTAAATSSSAPAAAGTAASTSSATSAASAGPTPIGVALTYNNTAFWSAYINYETQYAKQMHIKLLGPLLAGTNASLQNQQVEDLVNEGAKAVIVNPETATSLGPAISYAAEARREVDLSRHDRRRRQGLHGRSRVQPRVRGGRLRSTSAIS